MKSKKIRAKKLTIPDVHIEPGEKEALKVYYKNQFLLRVNRKTALMFLENLIQQIEEQQESHKILDRAKKFELFYRRYRAKKTGTEMISKSKPGDRDFKHFIKAAKAIKAYRAKMRDFLDAQVHGLTHLNNGRGMFPLPHHLSTSGAEERYRSWMEIDADVKVQEKGMVLLTQEDRKTPLYDNTKYISAKFKVQEEISTLEETMYVREMQKIHKSEVDGFVEKRYEKLTGGRFG